MQIFYVYPVKFYEVNYLTGAKKEPLDMYRGACVNAITLRGQRTRGPWSLEVGRA